MILFCSINFLIVVAEFYSVTFLSVLFPTITCYSPQPMINSFLSTHYSTQYKIVTFLLCSITSVIFEDISYFVQLVFVNVCGDYLIVEYF